MIDQTPKSIISRFYTEIPITGTNAKILDLGCGFGRNTVFLARKGFRVDAVDVSKDTLERLKQNAENQGLLDKITLIHANIENFHFEEDFATIICTDVLHFFNKEKIYDLINAIKNHTIPRGINIVTVFTTKGDLCSNRMYFFQSQELKNAYADWEIIFYEERMKKTLEKDR